MKRLDQEQCNPNCVSYQKSYFIEQLLKHFNFGKMGEGAGKTSITPVYRGLVIN